MISLADFNLDSVSGLGPYTMSLAPTSARTTHHDSSSTRRLYYRGEHVFLVINENTLELRTDQKLARVLINKYESVMESRYFGRGGIEIVPAGQLTDVEILDLIRLSYNLTVD